MVLVYSSIEYVPNKGLRYGYRSTPNLEKLGVKSFGFGLLVPSAIPLAGVQGDLADLPFCLMELGDRLVQRGKSITVTTPFLDPNGLPLDFGA